jgi:hypothetical protein
MRRSSLQDWASIAEIIGAIAIVVSLIYVAFEIRENTRALQVTSRQALGDQDLMYFQTGIDSNIMATALDKFKHGEELSRLEMSQLQERQHLNFRIFEHAYSLYRGGALEPLEWERYERIIRDNVCTNEAAQGMWEMYKVRFDTEFRRVVGAAAESCTP